MDIKGIHKNAELIRDILRLKPQILAIKMLETEGDIPASAIRPVQDIGYHLDLCQGYHLSKWNKQTIAMTKEDMWCFEPVVGLGLAEPAKEYLNGENRWPWSVMKKEDAAKWASNFPRFEVGKYIGIVSAPLNSCDFEPDLFIIYCDPSQLTQLLITKNCIDGEDIYSILSGHSACVYSVVPVLKNNRCAVTSPCNGDRHLAMSQDNEIMFSGPISKLEEYAEGLIYLDKNGWEYPRGSQLRYERDLANNYKEIGIKMGMDYLK
jgi:uncharacterized protein (DUF169 family)